MSESLKHQDNLGLDLVRVTEASALNAARYMGLGKRDDAHSAATQAVSTALSHMRMKGKIVIGEEGRLGMPSNLDTDAEVGDGTGPMLDVIVDPIDGTSLLSEGQHGPLSVIAVAPRGSMWAPHHGIYMNKIVVNRYVADKLVPECLTAPAAWTLALIAREKSKKVRNLVVFVLKRPRHKHLIDEIRDSGARVILAQDGDVSGALLAALPDGKVDVMMGVGGLMEGVVSACAVKSLGGAMLGSLSPQNDEEKQSIEEAGFDENSILMCDDLVRSSNIFFAATGIVDGMLLEGVKFKRGEAETESLVIRCATKTRRIIHTVHTLNDDENGNSTLHPR